MTEIELMSINAEILETDKKRFPWDEKILPFEIIFWYK